MRVILVPGWVSGGPERQQQYLTSLLVNDTVALDAGGLGFYRTPREQARVKHVFLSHSHQDHVASLPMFLDNTYSGDGDCVTVYGSAAVLDSLRSDVFNGRLWPNFIQLSAERPPYLKLRQIEAGETVEAGGLRVTAVPVVHTVPTFGFIVEDGAAAFVFSADTAPTEEIWQRANRTPHLKAVFLEATFPDEMAWLADVAKHLTPSQFLAEVRKLQRPVPVIAVHLHPRHRRQVIKELRALKLSNLQIGRFDWPYEF
jgi:ribonuclease BN (tRNA processing enzyme)